MINLEITSDELLKYVGELYLDTRTKEEQIYLLKAELEKLYKQVSINSAEDKTKELQTQIESLNNEIIRLRQTNSSLQGYIDSVEKAATQTAEERDRLKIENANLTERAKSLEVGLNSVKYAKSKKRNEVGTANA